MRKTDSFLSLNTEHFDSYRSYFGTGYYKKRYPRPNLNTLKAIMEHVNKSKSVVDFGCGDGRYSLEIAKAAKKVTCLDISDESVVLLKQSIQALRIKNIDVKIEDPPLQLKNILPEGSVDVVTMIFGVLSHITDAELRIKTLQDVFSIMQRETIFILSVPNKNRRFLREQVEQRSDIIRYTREHEGKEFSFNYKLYDVAEIVRDLSDAGFCDIKIRPESIIPETIVVKYKILGIIDGILCKFVPNRLAYGLLVLAYKG